MKSQENSSAEGGGPRRLLDELVSRALAYRSSDELKALLEFNRRFPHLAPYNVMLLHVQNPGISHALRAPDWERKYLRRVKPGARPYVILQTMGPVGFVFDVGDTEPMDLLAPPLPETVTNPFPTRGDLPPRAAPHLLAACNQLRITVDEHDYGTSLAGRVDRVEEKHCDFLVGLNSRHSSAQKFGSLAHELGHVFCGHLGRTKSGFWPDRREMAKRVKEFEAEAVAYLVTDRMGLDIGSAGYLAAYLEPRRELPNYSLEAVLKAAGKVEEMAAGRFRACLKTLEDRRVRARGLQAWAEKPGACRPGALTGRVFKHALRLRRTKNQPLSVPGTAAPAVGAKDFNK